MPSSAATQRRIGLLRRGCRDQRGRGVALWRHLPRPSRCRGPRGFLTAWNPYQGPTEIKLDPHIWGDGAGTVCVLSRHRAVDPKRGARLDATEVSVYHVRDRKVVRSQMFHADSSAVAQFLTDAQSAAPPPGAIMIGRPRGGSSSGDALGRAPPLEVPQQPGRELASTRPVSGLCNGSSHTPTPSGSSPCSARYHRTSGHADTCCPPTSTER